MAMNEVDKVGPVLEHAVQVDPTKCCCSISSRDAFQAPRQEQRCTARLAEFRKLKQRKEQLQDTYNEMRFAPGKQALDQRWGQSVLPS